MQQRGDRVDIVAPGAPGLADMTQLEGMTIRRARYASEARMTLAYTGTMAEDVRRSWSARWALVGLLRALRQSVTEHVSAAHRARDPYDIVHAHWWFPSGLALWRAAALERAAGGPPLVVTMHGSDVRLAQRASLAHPVMRAVLDRAAACTAVSTWLAEQATRIAPRARVTVAPMPVDTRHFALGDDRTGRSGILFVGRLNTQKGLAKLLQALAMTQLQQTTLDVVGDGPDADALIAQAASLGVSSRIRWHGTLAQPLLVPLYQRAQCVAIPSTEEGLGLVAVEAQLCGTPVVAFASGGLIDVVRPDAGGLLVAPNDIPAMAESIGLVLRDAREATRLGHVAREATLARFSPDAVAARYADVYGRARDARR